MTVKPIRELNEVAQLLRRGAEMLVDAARRFDAEAEYLKATPEGIVNTPLLGDLEEYAQKFADDFAKIFDQGDENMRVIQDFFKANPRK